MSITPLRIVESIGDIDDLFLEEIEAAFTTYNSRKNRNHIVKYGAAGLAVSFGAVVAYLVFKSKKAA